MKRRICISSDGDDDDHSMSSFGGKDDTKLDTLLEKLIDSVLMMNGKMERLSNRVDTLDEKVNQVKSELVKLKKSQQEKKQTVFVGSHLVSKLSNFQQSVDNQLPVHIASSSEGWRSRDTHVDVQQHNHGNRDLISLDNLERRKTVYTAGDEGTKTSHGKEDDLIRNKEKVPDDASGDEVAEHSQRKDEHNNLQQEVEELTQGSVKSPAPTEAFTETVSKENPTSKGTEQSNSKDADNKSEEEAQEPVKDSVISSAKKEVSRKSELKKTPKTKGTKHSQSKHKGNDSEEEPEEPEQGSLTSAKKEASKKSESKKTPTTESTEHSQSKHQDHDLEEEAEEPTQGSVKSSAEKESSRKSELKKAPTPKIATTISSPEKHSTHSTSKRLRESSRVGTPVASSKKRKDMETSQRKCLTPAKSATNVTTSKKKAATKLVQGKDERSKGLNPSKDELRCKIAQILNEVDFNTATFTDIFKKLAAHYDVDLKPRIGELKRITKEELMKHSNDEEEETEEDEVESDEEDAPKPAEKRSKT